MDREKWDKNVVRRVCAGNISRGHYEISIQAERTCHTHKRSGAKLEINVAVNGMIHCASAKWMNEIGAQKFLSVRRPSNVSTRSFRTRSETFAPHNTTRNCPQLFCRNCNCRRLRDTGRVCNLWQKCRRRVFSVCKVTEHNTNSSICAAVKRGNEKKNHNLLPKEQVLRACPPNIHYTHMHTACRVDRGAHTHTKKW